MKIAGHAHAVRHGFIGVTPGFKTKPSVNYMYGRIKFHIYIYSKIISE